MQIWVEVRRRVSAGETGKREACREYHPHWDTLAERRDQPEPPGSRLQRPRARHARGRFLAVIRAIPGADRPAPKKPPHTARRVFDRFREEHRSAGRESIVRAAVAEWERTAAEVFVPRAHPPGE